MAIALVAVFAVLGTVLGIVLAGRGDDDDTRVLDEPTTRTSDQPTTTSGDPTDGYNGYDEPDSSDDTGYDDTASPYEDDTHDTYDDALSSLQEIAAYDEVNVEEISGQWTVQLSSKTDGTEVDGYVYTYADILSLHEDFQAQYSTALLVDSTNWGSYQLGGYWVTLLGETFATSGDALMWCRDNGYDADGIDTDDCAAKRVSRDGDYREDTDVWPPGD